MPTQVYKEEPPRGIIIEIPGYDPAAELSIQKKRLERVHVRQRKRADKLRLVKAQEVATALAQEQRHKKAASDAQLAAQAAEDAALASLTAASHGPAVAAVVTHQIPVDINLP